MTNNMDGVVHGDSVQAGRDIHHDRSTHTQLDVPDPWVEFFVGRGLGRLLMVIGLLVALAGFGGWMYLILHGGELDDPSFNPFDDTILGLSAPMVAFGSFTVGAVVSRIGLGLSRAARQRRGADRHRPPVGR